MRLLFYNLVFPLAFVLYLPVFISKLLRRGGFWHNFGERFGLYSAAQKRALRQRDRPVSPFPSPVSRLALASCLLPRPRRRELRRARRRWSGDSWIRGGVGCMTNTDRGPGVPVRI